MKSLLANHLIRKAADLSAIPSYLNLGYNDRPHVVLQLKLCLVRCYLTNNVHIYFGTVAYFVVT